MRMPNRWALVSLPAVAFVVVAFLAPMAQIVIQSLTDPSPSTYGTALHSAMFRRSLVITFEMAVTVTLFCLVVAYPYAYMLVRAGRLLRGVLMACLMVSFWTSLLVRTFAWQVLLNDRGLINKMLQGMGIRDSPLEMMHTTFAVDLGMVHILAPYMILALYAQMRNVGEELEMAARSMGATPWKAFCRVVLPLSLPGALAGSVLVFILSLGFYITPAVLGGAGSVYIGQAIVTQVETLLKTGVGAAMSVMLFGLVIVVLALAARFVRLGQVFGLNTGGGR